MAATISSIDASFSSLHVKSTTDTSGVGTRNAMPVSLPFRLLITLPTAFAAPVDAGMMFSDAQRPARQSFPPRDGPSTVSWFAVIAWTVVIRPSTIPNLSLIAFASRAPRDGSRVLLGEHFDLLAINVEGALARGHGA